MERVEHWRAEELIRAGFDPSDAVALAAGTTSTCTSRSS